MSKYLSLMSLVFLAGCVQPQKREFNPRMCNKNAAYEAGYNDGMSVWSGEMNSDFLNNCRDDLREQAQNGYRDGYFKGREALQKQQELINKQNEADERASQPPQQGPSSVNSGTQINVNIGANRGATQNNGWYCKVTAFMDTYDGFGATQMETRYKVLNLCKAKHHEMHCDDIECQRNQ